MIRRGHAPPPERASQSGLATRRPFLPCVALSCPTTGAPAPALRSAPLLESGWVSIHAAAPVFLRDAWPPPARGQRQGSGAQAPPRGACRRWSRPPHVLTAAVRPSVFLSPLHTRPSRWPQRCRPLPSLPGPPDCIYSHVSPPHADPAEPTEAGPPSAVLQLFCGFCTARGHLGGVSLCFCLRPFSSRSCLHPGLLAPLLRVRRAACRLSPSDVPVGAAGGTSLRTPVRPRGAGLLCSCRPRRGRPTGPCPLRGP